MYSLGFVGGGRITRIMLEGFLRKDLLPTDIFVSDVNRENLLEIKRKFPTVNACESNVIPATQDMVILAVHPISIENVLVEIKGVLREDAILVSLAPKYTIRKMSELLDGFNRIVRMNPNAPSIVNRGFIPVTFSDALGNDEKKEIIEFFSILGNCFEVDEWKIEAYAVVTGMGPTYFLFQFKALIDIACEIGLKEEEAFRAVKEMINGTISMMFDSGMSYDEVVDLVPLKPLSKHESEIVDMLNRSIKEVYMKIKPTIPF
ncbi:MAG: pyrroline-5-carboxylate reductase family protein [Thermosulfidibacteraceae bacterium]